MQRPGGICPVLTRGEHQQISVRLDEDAGKPPFGRLAYAVRQGPARHVDRSGAAVVDLYPIRLIVVLVVETGVVDGHELIDPDQILSIEASEGREKKHKDEQRIQQRLRFHHSVRPHRVRDRQEISWAIWGAIGHSKVLVISCRSLTLDAGLTPHRGSLATSDSTGRQVYQITPLPTMSEDGGRSNSQ